MEGIRKIRFFSHQKEDDGGQQFLSNSITTAKYNLITFLPRFLFEQFRRYPNLFFLSVSIFQQLKNNDGEFISPTSRYVTIFPLMFVLCVTAIKEIFEDFQRHNEDRRENESIASVFSKSNSSFELKQWNDVKVGDVVKVTNGHCFPADMVLLSSSCREEKTGTCLCYIETSQLDGETNLKIRAAIPETENLNDLKNLGDVNGKIECEAPNRDLYGFSGNIQINSEQKKYPLTPMSILLRGARLMNTDYIIGVVIYSGHETKLLMNSTKAPSKRSNMDKMTDRVILILFLTLVFIAAGSTGGRIFERSKHENHTYIPSKTSKGHIYTDEPNVYLDTFFQFLTFLILYNNLIPISLIVTLECVKFIQSFFINWDQEMYYNPSKTFAKARTSNLNEDLGQIRYIFSDKTGTLTQNSMEYYAATIGGQKYFFDSEGNALGLARKSGSASSGDIDLFFTLINVCHTVVSEKKEDGSIVYNAASPDERALIEGSSKYGFKFIDRDSSSIEIEVPGPKRMRYEILNVIEFTSARKRMSIIVRCPDQSIKLFIKGADAMIMNLIGQNREQTQYLKATDDHLHEFAVLGFRTLSLAYKTISEDHYNSWKVKFDEASIAVEDKDEKLDDVARTMENDLTLLGATAIEDKLQDGVPETIATLIQANIRVWVLTGDKQETAINIGYSCKLLTQDSKLIKIKTSSMAETKEKVLKEIKELNRESAQGRNVSVIIDGKSLMFALDKTEKRLRKDVYKLLCICKSVICCRVSPIQKAEVVELVKENTKYLCLAIGDGANDVAMIQKAHIGVGINGNEGLQAANNSDFAIAQFRFLKRLLLVHGAWFHTRIAKLIYWSFYKNICLYIIELWFAKSSYWTGQTLFESYTKSCYNIIMTAAPPVAIGLFDKTCSDESRMGNPRLYHATQNSDYFNHKVSFKWVSLSICHSLVLYYLPVAFHGTGIIWSNGFNADYLTLGNIVYTCVIVTVNLKAGLELDSWNCFHHLSIWGSIGAWFLLFWGYSELWSLGLRYGNWPADMSYMFHMVVTSPSFYSALLIVPFTTLIVDVVIKYISNYIYPNETHQTRQDEKLGIASKKRQLYNVSNLSALEITQLSSYEQAS